MCIMNSFEEGRGLHVGLRSTAYLVDVKEAILLCTRGLLEICCHHAHLRVRSESVGLPGLNCFDLFVVASPVLRHRLLRLLDLLGCLHCYSAHPRDINV